MKASLKLQRQIDDITRIYPGWQDAERGIRMAELVLEKSPVTIVEIGVYCGRSFFPQALALKEILGELGDGTIFGIDPWNEAKPDGPVDMRTALSLFMDGLRRMKLEPYSVIICGQSRYCSDLFFLPGIDILHIDGSHDEDDAMNDVLLYGPKLKQGGYIWFDDVEYTSLKRALYRLEDFCTLVEDYKTYRLYQKD